MRRLVRGRCGRKFIYRTKIDALVAGATILKKKASHAHTFQYRAYKCHLCHGWHLTKQEERKGGEMRWLSSSQEKRS